MPSRYVLGHEGARKLRELFAAKSAGGRRPGAGAAPVFDADFSAPFTVQWAASLATPESSEGAGDGTAGEWIIYLPTAGLLKVGTQSVGLTGGLEAAGGGYPAGWYRLVDGNDDAIVDRDDGGTLYLNVTLGGSPSAEFSGTAGSGQNVSAIKICTVAVDSASGARTVKQFVSSVIVVGSGGEDHDTITTADERSISREYLGSGDGAVISHFSNIVQIKGFGRFHPDAEHYPNEVRGTFVPSSQLELDEFGESGVAAVVRTYDADVVDANGVAFRKLKLKGVAEPFKYAETVETDPESGETTVSRALTNCQFFFCGELHTLQDVPVQASKTYYLNIVGQQDASTGDMTWTYAVSDTAASSGHLYMAIPIVETGSDGRPVKDYRAASLSYALPNRPFHFNGTLLAHILADDDIDIGTKRIVAGRGIDIDDDGDEITISALLELAAGAGIVISNGAVAFNPDGNSIAFTQGSGNGRKAQLSGFNAPGSNTADMTLGRALAQEAGANVRYALVAVPYNGVYVLKYMALDKIAVDAAAESGLEFTATQDSGGRPVLRLDWPGRETGETVELANFTLYGSDGVAALQLKVPATGDIEIPGVKAGRGVTVTPDDDGATNKIDADVADIQSDSDEIEVTRDEDGVVHIALSGEGGGSGSSEAHTGQMKVCSGLSYNTTTHKLVATFTTYQVNNGIIMANPVTSTEDVFTAVEETV